MKKILAVLAMAAALTVVADVKIGTVNMVDLVKLHPSYETNRALLKSTDKDYKAKLDKQQEDLKVIADEGKKAQEDLANPMLSNAAKIAAQKKLEEVQRRYIAARQEMESSVRHYQSELADLESRLMKLQTDELRAKISAFAKEKDYDMILDSTMLVFSKDYLDVTDEILKAMNVDPAKRKTLKDEKPGKTDKNDSKFLK